MSVIEIEGKKIELDEEGYLVHSGDWNEKVACALADKEGVSKTCPLSADKIEILKFMREYFKKHNAFPITRAICKNVNQPAQCIPEKFLEPIKAWKIAGLPRPTDEVLSGLS
ncbi:MAG: TusE/DsrC/DsvC family sulfur relay protein [Nitrospirota bacterium]